MKVALSYTNNGRTVDRHIEFNGPEAELVDLWNAVISRWAQQDSRFSTVGGSNADLQSASVAATTTPVQ